MRILIATLALTTGCYEPSVTDCQYTCTAEDTCADGMSCQSGYCRPLGASGTCQGNNENTDAGMDGTPDAPSGCPTPPSGCTVGMTFTIGTTGCAVVCLNQSTWTQASTTCTNADWHFATLHPSSELLAVPTLSNAPWVGAERQSTNPWRWVDGVQVDTTAWEGGTPPLSGCAQINMNKKLINDTNCGATHVFICEHD